MLISYHCQLVHFIRLSNIFTALLCTSSPFSYFLVQCEALSEARVEEVSIALCPDTSGNHKPLFGLDIGELKVRLIPGF